MKSEIETDHLIVSYKDDEEVREKVFKRVLGYFKENEIFSGEAIHQDDNAIISAPNVLSDIADDILMFNVVDKDDVEDLHILPCPFCGNELESTKQDNLHPSTTTWTTVMGEVVYGSHKEYTNQCWEVNCVCGVDLVGDTKESVISQWNNRVGS